MDKVFNHKREEITLPDTLESLVAQLSIRAMQSVDIEACKKGEAFFNDEEFEAEVLDKINKFMYRAFYKACMPLYNQLRYNESMSDFAISTETVRVYLDEINNKNQEI